MMLGAGRAAKEDVIDPSAGILIKKKRGERVSEGEVLAVMLTDREETLDAACERFVQSVVIGDTAPAPEPLIYGKIN